MASSFAGGTLEGAAPLFGREDVGEDLLLFG